MGCEAFTEVPAGMVLMGGVLISIEIYIELYLLCREAA